jgi:hypothetical protein
MAKVLLHDLQKYDNERFFESVIHTLNEGGVYTFKDFPECRFIKSGEKFICTLEGYGLIKDIVSDDFLKTYFEFDF